ncbi:MAG: ABC transporter ATP-binding protein [Chloroflexi bacterium]|nr:ABC transporter ATP-binding protein [Chloroflexota bacterium]
MSETKKRKHSLLGNKWRDLDLSEAKAVQKKDDTGLIIKRLLGYMISQKNRGKFGIAMVVRVLSVICLIAIPTLTGQAINVASDPNGAVNDLLQWVGIAVVMGVLFLLLSLVAERVFSSLATWGLYNLQTSLFAHLQTLSLNFFDRQPVGELMSRVTNDLETVALFYESAVAQIIRALIQIILIFAGDAAD